MFKKILIANRGEIACRVASTARQMGIATVAVYSDADRHAAHVEACDEAVYIGGSEPAKSYLRIDAIIEAAKKTGAEAIHPGYGFLAENGDFVAACQQAGITFIGPSAEAMAAMGSKSAAKTLMEKAGVPLVPGYHRDNQDPDFLHQQADSIGYPVLIKASAGGGGKGMRIVNSSDEFIGMLESCKREAINSFSNDHVLIERYVTKPRHIEIQVFGDEFGNYVYLFERDCSVQRRHQKVIEEAPAPGMTEQRRRAMGEAAVNAARAVNYVGAGTVEFIAEQDGTFYFMEMNTRLQVEHPVTEMITGYDLVEWQLRIANKEPIPVQQADLAINGHAIEVRIYAENPDNDFLPSIGQLSHLSFPEHLSFINAPIRVDSGIREGDRISPFYDPMIAKLIVWGVDREQAIARMCQALLGTHIIGLHTNVSFLHRLITNEAFVNADLDTGLIEKNHASLFPPAQSVSSKALAYVAATYMAKHGLKHSRAAKNAPIGYIDPWASADYWRVRQGEGTTVTVEDDHNEYPLRITQRSNDDWILEINGVIHELTWDVNTSGNNGLTFDIKLGLDGDLSQAKVVHEGEELYLYTQESQIRLRVPNTLAHAAEGDELGGGGLTAPMPGKVINILVNVGDRVEAGDVLLVMEAMKMEHSITADTGGTVEELFFAVGDQVTEGAELIKLNSDD
ncbi:Acetyl-/propionyl-coenzyme A carboxylase alpha chain [Oligella ureolytica]|uniref:Acetyl-/propionyl-coenzyme A carboxylase alpha chain n=1 Tax=Oligella ureolytica TaxID=90244 RepID=A0A378XFE8_9BURK|nr:acetyl/propionyl/methylcrotonyl-CoA carboxylase subunit alpha [Oligella ureolytica]QPT39055.1 acetyl/propionyl/methylcrotonyl-CoA carboxylase subunit alpha [Oligella ureolytica]SUA54658.1 Acetyl-/propionyl-coenzyme A carboxylase alpha chain [Oligella ureolytica]